MKRLKLLFYFFISYSITTHAHSYDSLLIQLKSCANDTILLSLLSAITNHSDNPDWKIHNEELIRSSEKLVKMNRSNRITNVARRYYAEGISNRAWEYRRTGKIEAAIKAYMEAAGICKQIGANNDMISYYNDIAAIYRQTGNTQKALNLYKNCLQLLKQEPSAFEEAIILNNMAQVFDAQGRIEEALAHYLSALNKLEEQQAEAQIGTVLNNIAMIYQGQGDFEKALSYFQRSLALNEKSGNKNAKGSSLNNLGLLYYKQKKYGEAEKYFREAMRIKSETGDLDGVARGINNCAGMFLDQKKYDSAMVYFQKALSMRRKLSDMDGVSNSLKNISSIYIYYSGLPDKTIAEKKKWHQLALSAALESIQIGEDMNSPSLVCGASYNLYQLYLSQKDHGKALQYFEKYTRMNDSINNENTRKASIKSQLKYEYEKQATADSVAHAKESEIKNVELAKQKTEIKAKKNQQYVLFGGLFCVCVFGAFMFNRYKVTQKQKILIEHQKEIVEEQKHLVEEKQKEILDSIKYAKRIQMAQVPSEKRVHTMLSKLKT